MHFLKETVNRVELNIGSKYNKFMGKRFSKQRVAQAAVKINKVSKTSSKMQLPDPSCYIEYDRFLQAKRKIVGKLHNDKGIGTLSEKTVHGILKNFYEPEEDCQEVALNGYVADIYNGEGVIEIQTRSFNKMREKLSVFLNYYPVTIVYPMPYNKWVSWVNTETGEAGPIRKSPRHFTGYDAFYELYKIKPFLTHPNLRFRFVLMDMEEYKLLNGWNESKKRGATRYDRIPLGIRQIITIDQTEDYMQFVPYELEEKFTSKDFAKAGKIPVDTARQVLQILNYTGTVRRVGKQGNNYIYEINEA